MKKFYALICKRVLKGSGKMEKLREAVKKLLSAQTVRYLISSCAAFAAEYTLLLLLNSFLGGITVFSMELAAIIAFVCGSQINFWINRGWVFRSEKAVLPELGGYYSLAAFSFSVKTFVLLEIMVRLIGIPLAAAKPIVEAAMFAVNYLVQKTLIFRRKNK